MPDHSIAVHHAADAPEPVRFAADELARYLGHMTGQTIAVASAAGQPPLALGLGQDASDEAASLVERLAGRVQPVPPAFTTAPGADAFLWQTGAGRATVVGSNPRSTLFGVYDLLEELGCRFYGASAEDEVVPTGQAEAVARFLGETREQLEQATFPYRERHFLEWIDAAATVREIDYAAKRRMNAFAFHIEDFAPDEAAWQVVLDELVPEIARRGLMPGLGEHGGYVLWLPPARYAADHPEWYAQVGGRRVGTFRDQHARYQFCTENPDALATFLDNMLAFLRDNPKIQLMHIAPEDVGRWCECERCAPIPVADRYMRLDNAIVERIHAIRPDVSVTHLVYANHAELPERERPSSHLKIAFIPFGRNFGVPFTEPAANMGLSAHPWSLDLIRAWAALCHETGAGLIEHTKAFRHRWLTFRLLPLPHLESDMRWWQSIGGQGFNSPQEGEGWWVKHLNAYVYARLMWDLDAGVERLLDDYFERYWAGIGRDLRSVFEATAAALPDLSYARNPTVLPNRHAGYRPPADDQLGPEIEYLAQAADRLDQVGARVAALSGTGLDSAVAARLAKLRDAFEGARAAIRVSLELRRAAQARGTAGARAAVAAARAAHDRFAALQTPERLRAGTLWTGAWRRDHVLAEWEREAASTSP